jgi:hypothetical protein
MKIKIRTTIFAMAFIFGLFCISDLFAQQTYQATAVKPSDVSGDLLDLRNTTDDRMETRAYSGKKNYAGMSFTIDLGSDRPVIGVSQDHGRWPTHYPGAYRVDVATNLSGPWFKAWEGEGVRGESKAKFPAILARYIRVTATEVNATFREEWSIAEIRGGIDPGQKPRVIPNPSPNPPPNPPNGNPGPIPPAINKQLQPAAALDDKLDTFANSGTPDYAGFFIVLDLGGEYELSRVIQNHGTRAEDYPAEYKIEVSRARNENQYREVWRGKGEAQRSTARFDPVVTRFVRITALAKRDNTHWWSIAELRTNRDPDTIDRDEDNLSPRPIRAITAQGLSNINAVIDDNNTTRATTGNANYLGSFVTLDLGGNYTVSRLVQIHDPDERDFPARYRIEVSSDGKGWQRVFEGQGERNRSVADFTPVRARYLRIVATDNRNNRPWTIYKLKVRG